MISWQHWSSAVDQLVWFVHHSTVGTCLKSHKYVTMATLLNSRSYTVVSRSTGNMAPDIQSQLPMSLMDVATLQATSWNVELTNPWLLAENQVNKGSKAHSVTSSTLKAAAPNPVLLVCYNIINSLFCCMAIKTGCGKYGKNMQVSCLSILGIPRVASIYVGYQGHTLLLSSLQIALL